MIRWPTTNSWLRGDGRAQRLRRYRADHAGQLFGITWYFPYAPDEGFTASNRPPDSTHASPAMKVWSVIGCRPAASASEASTAISSATEQTNTANAETARR